jgi:hypothetical protein
VTRAGSAGLALAAVVLAVAPAAAQDADVDPLLLTLERAGAVSSAHATSYQIYRMPLSYAVRDPADHQWGLSLTFPVSLGANELSASTGAGDFFERIQTLSIVPGLEVQTFLGPSWVLKPYAEAGLRATTLGENSDATVAIGVRSVGEYAVGAAAVRIGLAARYASPRTHRDVIDDYTSLEVGVDVQRPLGFTAWRHAVSGGVYAITRYFPRFPLPETSSLQFAWTHEVGLSLSTSPTAKILGIKIPWIGLGYRFGDAFTGVRLNLSFPF